MFKKLFNRKFKQYQDNLINNDDKECDKTCCYCNIIAYKYKQCQNCRERTVCKTCYYEQDKILCKGCDKEYTTWQQKLEKLKEQQAKEEKYKVSGKKLEKAIFIIGDDDDISDDFIEYSLSKSLDIEHSYTEFLNVTL